MELINRIQRPVYVYRMASGINTHINPDLPLSRSANLRRTNALTEIENLLQRWDGPDERVMKEQ
jgi:hypothetical protein